MDGNLKIYFKPQELFCKHMYAKHGDKVWNFLDPRLADTLAYIRVNLAKPITVNNWHNDGAYSQRGFRCNLCTLVANKTKTNTLYASAHAQGMLPE